MTTKTLLNGCEQRTKNKTINDKMITKIMNSRIRRQKIEIFSKTKYQSLIHDENLFKNNLVNSKFKLIRENCLLAKIRSYVSPLLLCTMYNIMQSFDSHLR